MTELQKKKNCIPDWYDSKAIIFVYPYKLEGRAYLCSFYDKLLSYIPEYVDIILLVKNSSFKNRYFKQCRERGILNNIDFIEYPELSDIWVRDFAPLTVKFMGMNFPVKFVYNPSYVSAKYADSVVNDDKIGNLLGEQLISKGSNWVEFKWDMGNITHNGKGIAIVSKQLISDNEKINVVDELMPVIKSFLGLSEIIFIPVEPLDVTGHVDGMVRFIDEKVLVVGAYPQNVENHAFMDKLAKELKADLGKDCAIIRLMNAEPENYSSEGVGSAVGNHVNFLRINNNILFPYYSEEISAKPFSDFKHDLQALNLEIQVIPVNIPEINKLARKGGVLNCISWHVFN